jgi:hypothetical protein
MSDNSHDSGLARFFSQFDLLGKLFGGDKFIVRQADTANKDLYKVVKKDPFIRADRQHGVGSWGGAFGKASDWAYNHPADATGAIATTAGLAAGAGGGAAAGASGAAAGGGATTGAGGGIGAAIGESLPTVTVTGSTGGGIGGAIGAGAAGAGAGAAANSATNSNPQENKWANLAKNLGSNLQQQGQSEEDKMLEMLARQGPPPQVMQGGGNLSPVPIDKYQQTLTPTPQKVFG